MSKYRELAEELRQEIDEARKDLATKEQLLAFLESKGAAAPQTEPEPLAPFGSDGIINLDEIDIKRTTGKRTLDDDVKDIVSRLGDQEFTVVHVHKILDKKGIEIPGKYPRSRISVALAALADDHYLVKTFAGKGNVPHRYRMATEAERMM